MIRSAGVAVIVASLLASSCATVVVERTRNEARVRATKGANDPIAVFEGDSPARAYQPIGTVRARVKLSPQRDRLWPKDRIVDALKSEARKLGGDALIGLRVAAAAGGGTYAYPGVVLTGQSELWSAVVVVWTSPER